MELGQRKLIHKGLSLEYPKYIIQIDNNEKKPLSNSFE